MLHSRSLMAMVGLMPLSALAAATCSDYSFTDDFSGGFSLNYWEQTGGIWVEDSVVQAAGGGLDLVIRAPQAGSVSMVSKVQFTSAKISFNLKTNNVAGVMYDSVVWPAANVAGNGEIDLELLGGQATNIIQTPIWAPGTSVPIAYSNAPRGWGTANPSGPSANFSDGKATTVQGWVEMPDFDLSATNRFSFDLSATKIACTVNDRPYATFTRGSDAQQWPISEEPMSIAFGLWANTSLSSWMGLYNFDEANPPTLSISDFSFSGCATTTGEVASSASSILASSTGAASSSMSASASAPSAFSSISDAESSSSSSSTQTIATSESAGPSGVASSLRGSSVASASGSDLTSASNTASLSSASDVLSPSSIASQASSQASGIASAGKPLPTGQLNQDPTPGFAAGPAVSDGYTLSKVRLPASATVSGGEEVLTTVVKDGSSGLGAERPQGDVDPAAGVNGDASSNAGAGAGSDSNQPAAGSSSITTSDGPIEDSAALMSTQSMGCLLLMGAAIISMA